MNTDILTSVKRTRMILKDGEMVEVEPPPKEDKPPLKDERKPVLVVKKD